MKTLLTFTEADILNLDSNHLMTQTLSREQIEIRAEKLIGVAPPLLSTVEDHSDIFCKI